MTELETSSELVLARHARTFHLASRLLPAAARRDAAILYAFCRFVDDTADEAPDPEAARVALTDLRDEMRDVRPPRPLVAETRAVLERGVGVGPALDLIDGVLGDLDPVVVGDEGELVRYGYRVAGTVGLMMCAVLGVTDRSALRFAVDLGVGMQITNICRDVAEDAERGRVYLPADRLREAGVEPEQVLAGTVDRRAVAAVVLDLLDLADRYYESADLGMRSIPVRSRVAIVVAARVYRAIGTVLRERGGDTMGGRAFVSGPRKAWLVVVACAEAVRLSWTPPVAHDGSLHLPLAGLVEAA